MYYYGYQNYAAGVIGILVLAVAPVSYTHLLPVLVHKEGAAGEEHVGGHLPVQPGEILVQRNARPL